jgi:hypothetical protein
MSAITPQIQGYTPAKQPVERGTRQRTYQFC